MVVWLWNEQGAHRIEERLAAESVEVDRHGQHAATSGVDYPGAHQARPAGKVACGDRARHPVAHREAVVSGGDVERKGWIAGDEEVPIVTDAQVGFGGGPFGCSFEGGGL